MITIITCLLLTRFLPISLILDSIGKERGVTCRDPHLKRGLPNFNPHRPCPSCLLSNLTRRKKIWQIFLELKICRSNEDCWSNLPTRGWRAVCDAVPSAIRWRTNLQVRQQGFSPSSVPNMCSIWMEGKLLWGSSGEGLEDCCPYPDATKLQRPGTEMQVFKLAGYKSLDFPIHLPIDMESGIYPC